MKHIITLILAAAMVSPARAAADFEADHNPRLARIFQDNMVLQQGQPVPVWGWAKPGTQVEVAFAGQTKTAKADEKGRWQATLDPLETNASPQELTVRIGSATETLKNVLVGEVWIVAGHSGTACGGPDIDTGLYPRRAISTGGDGKPEVRLFQLAHAASLAPLADIAPEPRNTDRWQTMNETAVWQNQTAYFARLVRTGGQPIETAESEKDGNKYATFDAPLDGTWIIVAEKGKAEGFRKINRY